MQKFYFLTSFKLPTKFITGALLRLLPVSASTHPGNSWLTLNLLTTKAEAAQVSALLDLWWKLYQKAQSFGDEIAEILTLRHISYINHRIARRAS